MKIKACSTWNMLFYILCIVYCVYGQELEYCYEYCPTSHQQDERLLMLAVMLTGTGINTGLVGNTLYKVVIHHTHRLHKGITNCWADEIKSKLL